MKEGTFILVLDDTVIALHIVIPSHLSRYSVLKLLVDIQSATCTHHLSPVKLCK